jgi:hypothetical protein
MHGKRRTQAGQGSQQTSRQPGRAKRVGPGIARQVQAGKSGPGKARHGKAGPGRAKQGQVRQGRQGKTGCQYKAGRSRQAVSTR